MVPKAKKTQCRRGVSLVGTLVAVVILLIALIGTSTFRYAAALDGRRADAHTTAARIALALCESWRGVKGDETYDPAAHLGSDLSVAAGQGPAKPDDFTLLGSYTVHFDDGAGVEDYSTTLSWKDVQPGLRALNVSVAYASRDQQEEGTKNNIGGVSADKSFGLTVYTETY
jgi:hypothetical protein